MQDKVTSLNTKTKLKGKKVIISAIITTILLIIGATISVTYAFFTSKMVPEVGITFGFINIGVDYTDNTKQTSTFSLYNMDNITPGVDIPLQASITSSAKAVNDLGVNSTVNSYLRFKVELTGYEDALLTEEVDLASQEDLDNVAQNIQVRGGVTTLIKGSDGYIYYAGNADASRKLEWEAGDTLTLNGDVYLNFSSAVFASNWEDRYCTIKLIIEAYQYEYMEIDYTSCADNLDKANCASSVIDDYNYVTGLLENQKTIRTSFCTSSLSTFTANTSFNLSLVGNASTLRVYSGGKRLSSPTDYSVALGSPNTVTIQPTPTSLYLTCSQITVDLVDEDDASIIYQTIYGKQDGSLPLKVDTPSKADVVFAGYYTGINGTGTQIYDESGTRVNAPTGQTTLYAHFTGVDVIVSYRNTTKTFDGVSAFADAFAFSQTLNAYDVTITCYDDFTLSSGFTVTSEGMNLTIKSAKKTPSTYYTLTFTGSAYNCFTLTSSHTGNTLCFKNINLVAPNSTATIGCINSTQNDVQIKGNVTFTDFDKVNGSAIYVSKANLSIYGENTVTPDVVFTNCDGTGAGGAVYVADTTDSKDYNLDIVNAKFINCNGTNGGAVYARGYTATIENVTGVSNTASGDGGVIYLTSNDVQISSGSYHTNTASGNGGVIYLNSGSLTITSGTFGGDGTAATANSATGGGVLYQNGGTLNITGGTFGKANFKATTSVYSNTASEGGAIRATGGERTITNAILAGNYASSNGGGMMARGATLNAGCNIYGNYTGNGGGVYSYSGTLTINGAVIGNDTYPNTATYYGGGIYISGTVTLNSGTIGSTTTSVATTTAGNHANISNSYGGGVYMYNGTFTIEGGLIGHNYTTYGGGIFTRNGTLNISGGSIQYNGISNSGGGIYTEGGGSTTANISGGNIHHNSAANGGGFMVTSGTVNITGGNIFNNTASNGAGITNDNGTLSISNANISDNTASTNGGGIYLVATTTITNSTISGNSGSAGGGVYCNAGATISGCEISDNTASGNGGGIYVNDKAVTISNSIITGNTSTGAGAGIYITSSTNVTTFSGSVTISDNEAGGNGGGLYLTSSNASAYNMDCNLLIADNVSTGSGGGAYLSFSSASVTLPRTIVTGNSAGTGGGLYISGTFTFTGGEIGENSATSSGGGIYAASGTITLTAGTVKGNSATNGAGIYQNSGTVNIGTNTAGVLAGTAVIGNDKSPNIASDTGGGVYVNGGTFNLNSGTIGSITTSVATTTVGGYANKAYRAAGIDIGTSGTVYVKGGIIGHNYTTDNSTGIRSQGTLYIQGGNIQYNLSGSAGAGIVQYNAGTTTISGGSIIFNTSTGFGGGITMWHNCISSLTLTAGRIYGNNATYGAGIYQAGGTINFGTDTAGVLAGTAQIGSIASPNVATSNGGGVYVAGGTFNFNKGIIGEESSSIATSTVNANKASGYGGGIYVDAGTFIIKSGVIASNYSSNYGGSIYCNVNATIKNCDIKCNRGASNVHITSSASVKFISCNFSSNYAQYGSAIYNSGGYAEIQGCTIIDNVTNTSSALGANSSACTYVTGIRGDAVAGFDTSDLTSWSSNYAGRFTATYSSGETTLSCATAGGYEQWYKAISLTSGKTYLISVDYENTTLNANISGAQVGTDVARGLKMQLLNATPTDSNCISLEAGDYCYANTGDANGTKARMYIQYTCTSTGTYYINFNFGVLSNSATHTIKLKNLLVTEYQLGTSTLIDGNSRPTGAGGNGGAGIFNNSTCQMALHDVTVSNNVNTMYGNGAGVLSYGPIQISNCNIFGNISSGDGAGLYLASGGRNNVITNCNIYNNISGANGGGICTTANAPTALFGVNIHDNSAINGGGIYAGVDMRIVSCNIYSNTASANGGGIYGVASQEVYILSGVVRNNTAVNGGGIYTAGVLYALLSAGIKNNTASTAGGGIYKATGGTFNNYGSVITGNSPEEIYEQ